MTFDDRDVMFEYLRSDFRQLNPLIFARSTSTLVITRVGAGCYTSGQGICLAGAGPLLFSPFHGFLVLAGFPVFAASADMVGEG